MKQIPSPIQLQNEIQQFIAGFHTAILASCNPEHQPEASYAPFIESDRQFYVYLSELAAHTGNLSGSGKCAFMLIESEQTASNPFARKRLSMHCEAVKCPRSSAEFDQRMNQFADRFGPFFKNIRELGDFHLFRLTPRSGNYVAGFAQAYTLSGDKLMLIRHRNEKGHGSSSQSAGTVLNELVNE